MAKAILIALAVMSLGAYPAYAQWDGDDEHAQHDAHDFYNRHEHWHQEHPGSYGGGYGGGYGHRHRHNCWTPFGYVQC